VIKSAYSTKPWPLSSSKSRRAALVISHPWVVWFVILFLFEAAS